MVLGYILTVSLHEGYIHVDSLIPLKRNLLTELAEDIGEKFYKSKKNIWVIVSSSCKKALVINTKGKPEYAKGLVINMAGFLKPLKPKGLLELSPEEYGFQLPEEDIPKLEEVFNLIKEYITLQSLPDIYLTPEVVKTLTMAHLSEDVFLKNNPYYVAITQRLKEDGIIDEDFRLKVSFYDFVSKLRQFFRELTTIKEEAYFRICPVCLTPYVVTLKTGSQVYCRTCNRKKRKAINKRIERLITKKPYLKKTRDKIPSLDFLKTYPEDERALKAWDKLKELAEKKITYQEINTKIETLREYHSLALPLIEEKKKGRKPHR